MEEIKNIIISQLPLHLPTEEIRRWFEPLEWIFDARLNRLRLVAPTVFHQRRLAEKYAGTLMELAAGAGRPLAGLSLESADRPEAAPPCLNFGPLERQFAFSSFPPINAAHGFSNFFKGESNRLAALALESFAEGERIPGSYSILISAPGPWGKTHLLDALALRLAGEHQRPFLKLNAESDPAILSGLAGETEAVIIDDIQLLAGKIELQRSLVQIFDEAPTRALSLILSSSAPPQKLTNLSEPLRSRLGGGLLLTLGPPEHDLMQSIGEAQARKIDLDIAPESLSLLLRESQNDPRCLKGLLNTVSFISARGGLSPDEAVKRLNLEQYAEADPKQVDIDSILSKVASAFGLKVSDLTGYSKLRQTAWPRRVAMLLARDLTRLTTAEIGAALGGRDHSTVIHALKKIQKELQNPAQVQIVENIKYSLLTS